MTINPKLVSIALEECETNQFERYSQTVMSSVVGPRFTALGGTHDGGADGFFHEHLTEHVGHPTRFFQASKQVTVVDKIRKTVARLKEFGRDPKTVWFAFSGEVQNSDKISYELGEELGCNIRIFDRNYFVQRANHSADVIAAFHTHLSSAVSFLQHSAAPSYPSNVPITNAREVCAFLGQEVERRLGSVRTHDSVCDALILWALEGTDPGKEIFMTKEQVLEKVESVLPTAKRFLRGRIDDRLHHLTQKVEGQRAVNHYRKEQQYCLPYETRQEIEATRIDDEDLKARTTECFRARLLLFYERGIDACLLDEVPALIHKTLELVFEKQGFDVSTFFLDGAEAEKADEYNQKSIVDCIATVIAPLKIPPEKRVSLADVMRAVMREVFYSSTETERTYCARLARTY